jgi:hypothetical protein
MTPVLSRVAIAFAVSAAWFAATNNARALDYEDIEGKWCGATTNYTFERKSLHVHWPSDGQSRRFTVVEYVYEDDEITVRWRKDGETVFTVFAGFSGRRMVQQRNENGPRREFRRC